MGRPFSRSRNFLLLRGGQFVGDLGGNVSTVALPATIILALHATALQIGVLDAVAFGMIPLCAAGAGIAADRVRRRPLLIAMNVVRLLAVASIPLAMLAGHAPFWLFVGVAAIVGAASSVFDAAYAGFVPSVVGEANIAAGTAKLALGSSVAEAAGTSLAGALVMLVGAPLVIFVNALTFAVSTLALTAMRVAEPPPRREPKRSIRSDLRDGVACIVAHPILRRVTLSNAVAHLGGGIAATVATAFIYRNLHVAPVVLGVVMGLANVGAVSALCADRIARRLGMRRTLAAAHLAASAGKVALPLLAAVSPIGAILLSRVCLTAAGPLFAVNETTLRLALVPAELRGRASATARAIVWTALPVGSLVGGVLGERIGLAATMALGAAITAAAALLLPAQWRFDAPASRHLRPKRKPRMPVPNDLSPSTI